MKRLLCVLWVTGMMVWAPSVAAGPVTLLGDPELPPAALYGLEVLTGSLKADGVDVRRSPSLDEAAGDLLVAGIATSDGPAARLLREHGIALPVEAEGLVVKRLKVGERPALVLCGADARGLMYALLDTAEQVRGRGNADAPLAGVRDTREAPRVKERAVSIYTMQRRWFEQRLFDERHWQRYFSLLASSRINSFVVVFGYENGGFMAPVYPYFHNVHGFPKVEMVGVTADQQTRHTVAFKRMMEIAHRHGIDVTVAFWDHIYRGKVQGGGIAGASEAAGKRMKHLVTGVTTENLVAYNKAALTEFLSIFPEVDAIQFRMHWESGLTREETPAFWHDMFEIIRKARPDLRIDLRAKGLPDPVIDDAVAQGLNFRIATKYWMEQMGLPFHPSHVNRQNQRDRRHGYADLLRYPKRYPVHWRMWSGGTTRCLLWGDPGYVRSFVESVGVYGGDSFEVNEMLATWMLGEDHDAEPLELLNARYRFYDYEFERYWYYYRVWGRVSYDPDLPEDVLLREFVKRFGAKGGPRLRNGLHLASRVLPRIVAAAYNYRNFPTTRGWAEMMRQGELPFFAKAEGSDIGQFVSFAEEARLRVEGGEDARRRPGDTSRWFANVSTAILREVEAAEQNAPERPGGEFLSTVADLKILAQLANYYSRRIPAAVSYNIHLQTKDPGALAEAIRQEAEAVESWREIVRAASDVYSFDMAFGVERVGFPRHWRDELAKLEDGLKQLKREGATASAARQREKDTFANGSTQLSADVERAKSARPGEPLRITAKVSGPAKVKWLRLRYRHLTQFEDYESVEMARDQQDGSWSATIPGEFIVPEWDLMYFVEVMDENGNGRTFPDLEQGAPYVIVELDR